MITLIDETELGKRCKNYLEGILAGTLLNDEDFHLVISPKKNSVHVNNIDLFNEIAERNRVAKIFKTGNTNFYNLIVSNPEQDDYFIVSLESELSKDFKNKYGEKYHLN